MFHTILNKSALSYQFMKIKSLESSHKYLLKKKENQNCTKNFYQWLILMFNGVDDNRVKDVGPDRACAEWLLRNGACVKWKGAKEYLKDYNFLPKEDQQFYLQHIDATNSAIHHVGFKHFAGCKYIEEIKLVRCDYINNDALTSLSLIKDSLKILDVIDCKNITDKGLLDLKNLTNLLTLRLGGMPYVQNKSLIILELNAALPNCDITYN